jgi:sterol desaturase/sphingolipid hydroxylase (fatty acid hydroxylase superfamily)
MNWQWTGMEPFVLSWFGTWSAIILGFLFLEFILNRFARASRFKSQLPTSRDYQRELFHNIVPVIPAMICTFILNSMLYQWKPGAIVRIPLELKSVYSYLSFPLMILAYDGYMYWTHRILHTRWLYRRIHYIHHQSRNPNPLTTLSAHFFETLLFFIFSTIYKKIIPISPGTFEAFIWTAQIHTTLIHMSYPIFPKFIYRKGWRIAFAGPFHHFIHHDKVDGNFGLYSNLWDYCLGTQHPAYEKELDRKIEISTDSEQSKTAA